MDASDINLYRGSLRQVRYWIGRALQAGLIPMVQGSPGIGKSAMIRKTAQDLNLKVLDDRVATNGPEHYSGLPDVSGNKAVYKPFDVFPLEGDPLPKDANGKEMAGWLLYLSEFNSGLPTTLVGVYKLLQEREVGQRPLHSKVFIVADGNRDEDRAITQALGSALQRRLLWLEAFVDGNNATHFDNFMMDVAIPQNWNTKTVAFLNWKRAYLNTFDPEHTDKTFACPGTWEWVSKLSDQEEPVAADAPLFCGAIGPIGVEYVSFCEQFGNLPTLAEILADPRSAPMPDASEGNRQWAVISMLIDETTDKNLSDIGDYVERFNLEFRILYWRSVQLKHPHLRREQPFIRAQSNLAKYLFGE